MGAEIFGVRVDVADLLEAFRTAVAEAHQLYGSAGYTGSIAEKSSVRVVSPPPGLTDDEKIAWADQILFHEIDVPALAWIDDKWSPAAAIRLEAGGWFFFGWASS